MNNAIRLLSRTAIILFFYALAQGKTDADPIPNTFDKNMVQFIFESTDGTNFSPVGTCFAINIPTPFHMRPHKNFLGVPIVNVPRRRINFLYFVTAKHVLFGEDGTLRSNLVIRLSSVSSGITWSKLSSEVTNDVRIITNADASVDVAVIAFKQDVFTKITRGLINKPPEDFKPTVKFACLAPEQISTKDIIRKLSVREGEDMFFVGLFTQFFGKNENAPICRFGRLSMISDEKIPWGKEGPQDLYLMETEAFGGNSGSPAFFFFDSGHKAGHTQLILAGVVKGYFFNPSEIMMMNSRVTPVSTQNVGIAAIVPAYQIYDILYSKEEQQYRTEVESAVFFDETHNSVLRFLDRIWSAFLPTTYQM